MIRSRRVSLWAQRTLRFVRYATALLISFGLARAWAMDGTTEPPPQARTAPTLQITRTEGPSNVVWGFFEPTAGHRVARLQVATLLKEYGKQGVFRVAWKPRVALTGFELRVTDTSAWPAVAPQLADILESLRAGREGVRLADVVVIFEDTGARFAAARAEIATAGDLQLRQAEVAGGGRRDVLLHLRGPRAGQVEFSGNIPVSPSVPES